MGQRRIIPQCLPSGKRGTLVVTLGALLLACVSCTRHAQTEQETESRIPIGLVYLLEHPSITQGLDGFKEELARVEAERNVKFDVIYSNAFGDIKNVHSILQSFLRADVSGVVALTTPCAQAAAAIIQDRPVIFVGVSDPVAAGLVPSLSAGRENVTGTTSQVPNEKTLALARELYPELRRLGILYSVGEANSRAIIDDLHAQIEAGNIPLDLVEMPIANSSELLAAANRVASRSDALLIINDNGVVSSVDLVLRAADAAGIPVFASDIDTVKRGAAFTYGLDYRDEGRAAARLVEKILLDRASPATIPVHVNDRSYLFLNDSFVSSYGQLPPDVVQEATIIGE